MADELILYHNPKCSTSRKALDALEAAGAGPTVVEYLKAPLDEAQLRDLLDKLDGPPADLVRKDPFFKDLGLDAADYADADAVVALLVEHPRLMQRPVAVKGGTAVIGRPVDRVLELGLRSDGVGVLEAGIRIGGTTELRNRLYRAPVLEGAGDGPDAVETYRRAFVPNARAGVGLIVQGSACPFPEGRTSPGMTCVDQRDKVLRLAPMVDEVHEHGAAIWIQVGHGGLYAMERWHQPYASSRRRPLLAPSPLPWYLSWAFRGADIAPMSAADVHQLADAYGRVAAWAREAGYDGIQLASSNAKLLDQFLSPFYNQRTDEFGGSVARRANVLRVIRERVAAEAGADFTCTVKVPVGEKAPPGTPHTTVEDGLRTAELCERWGFDAVTPVQVSVFPDTTLSRGGVPRSLRDNPGMVRRFASAAPSRFERAVIEAGYELGGRLSPYEPVWNRPCFTAAKQRVSVPVLAVGGIETRAQMDEILDHGHADLVGVGRPFYAEPDLPARILGSAPSTPARCRYSNLCVPAQMLGMKGQCYNPEVTRSRR